MNAIAPASWPAANIEVRPLAALIPYAKNARRHPPRQVAQIAESMLRFGWTIPILIDEGGGLLAGHGRILAAAKLFRAHPEFANGPVMVARGWSDEQKRAYVIADNRIAANAGWDASLLAQELKDLSAVGFDMKGLGFSQVELAKIVGRGADEQADLFSGPAEVAASIVGDVWALGPHRVMCGDSTSPADLAALMGDERAGVLHADPPYGMGKAADGVANDNLYREKLDGFQLAWWRACRPFLAPNASAYIWGNAPDLWRLWYAAGLGESEPLTLRNEIVWDKKSIAGMASPDVTQYPEATERCLFFQLGRHVLLINQTKDDFWEGWEPLRAQLAAERDKMGWGPTDIRRICGNHMHGHWFGRSQWTFITAKGYAQLQEAAAGAAFTRPFAELRAEYDAALAQFSGDVRGPRREEHNAARPFFDNSHDIMRDVWDFPRVTGDDRQGHATPKPVAMMQRVMLSSLRPGELALEPFAGSGSTLIGAELAGRRCFALELQGRYVDVTVRRWQQMTGRQARLVNGPLQGAPFDEVAALRAGKEVDDDGSAWA